MILNTLFEFQGRKIMKGLVDVEISIHHLFLPVSTSHLFALIKCRLNIKIVII